MTYKKLMQNAKDLKGVIELSGSKSKTALSAMAKARKWSQKDKALVFEIMFLLRMNRKHIAHILGMLKTGHRVTKDKALHNCGCNNLSARISELRDMGYGICGEMFDLCYGTQKVYWMA